MPLTAETKKEVIEEYQLSDQDTGSTKVQVALLSERINSLMDHFNLDLQIFLNFILKMPLYHDHEFLFL